MQNEKTSQVGESVMNRNRIASMFKTDTESSYDFKRRRHPQWDETYRLYRDMVVTNRLVQRQPINLPFLKGNIKTWLSKIDEEPLLKFEYKGKDPKGFDKEIIVNEVWMDDYRRLKLDLIDKLDKKQVALYGRSFKKLMFQNGLFVTDVVSPYDIDVDKFVNPFDIETADYWTHRHIYVATQKILANKFYDEDAKTFLKTFLSTEGGIRYMKETMQQKADRDMRMRSLGAINIDTTITAESIVEVAEYYKNIWSESKGEFVRHLIIMAADSVVLYNKPLEEAIGVGFLPFVTWAEDPDLEDFWCDSMGDTSRMPAKVLNIQMSSTLENTTLRNFGMFFYDSGDGKFSPKGWEAKPFGLFPVNGKPSDVILPVPIPDTTQNSLGFMNFVSSFVEKETAMTATEKGSRDAKQKTLGEIQIDLRESNERIASVAPQYRNAWKEFGEKWYKLYEANKDSVMVRKLRKKGVDGKNYTKEVKAEDFLDEEGFECMVNFKSEQDSLDNEALQKSQFMLNLFKDNPVAVNEGKRNILRLLGIDENKIDEIMSIEEQKSQPQVKNQISQASEGEGGQPPEGLEGTAEVAAGAPLSPEEQQAYAQIAQSVPQE